MTVKAFGKSLTAGYMAASAKSRLILPAEKINNISGAGLPQKMLSNHRGFDCPEASSLIVPHLQLATESLCPSASCLGVGNPLTDNLRRFVSEYQAHDFRVIAEKRVSTGICIIGKGVIIPKVTTLKIIFI